MNGGNGDCSEGHVKGHVAHMTGWLDLGSLGRGKNEEEKARKRHGGYSDNGYCGLTRWYGQVSSTFSFVLNTTLLAVGYLPWLWGKSTALYAASGFDPANEIGVTIVFFLLDSAKDLVLGLPWGLYSAFVLEEKHGFNRQTLNLFFVDKLKEV